MKRLMIGLAVLALSACEENVRVQATVVPELTKAPQFPGNGAAY